MKRSNKGLTESDVDLYFGEPMSRPHQRKDLQLCEQVQQAIALALADLSDAALSELHVVSVQPYPHVGRLQVLLEAPARFSVSHLQERLARVSSRLRSEVAASIHRKKVPTLSFCVVPAPELDDPKLASDAGDAGSDR